ncbi:MAG TPA: chromate transporter [Bryobacteraceae bacterium]|nr:chromate transporter [Bryobacteraceae bacterium]
MREATLGRLASIFLRIGNLTFGGGEPTIAALQRELVTKREWLTPEQYALAYSLARITPGTNILAFCAGIAWAILGWRGALACVVAATVPSAILVVLLTRVLGAWANDPFASTILSAILAAAVGLMLASAWLLVRPQLKRAAWPRAVALVAVSFLASWKLGLSPIVVLGLGALIGFLWHPGGEKA